MPDGRRLRDVSADRAIGAFELGYRVARTRGSHVILEHPSRKALVIPRHHWLRPGILLARIKGGGVMPPGSAEATNEAISGNEGM
ncbi:MAG TPA: type II toxin-antitoxin system HicA family toxin [Dehalococcoidia bacterium]|nr:type II toxin-antitoxin system HicA family toxin [Dehalococcoidia bacterium]